MNSKFVTDNRKLYGKGTVYQTHDPGIRFLRYGTFCIKKNTIYVNFFTKILTVYQS